MMSRVGICPCPIPDAHEDAVVADARSVDLPELQNIGRPVPLVDDRFHGVLLTVRCALDYDEYAVCGVMAIVSACCAR